MNVSREKIAARRKAILDRLKRGGATCQQLGDILGHSSRVIMRDIKALREEGHRIAGSRGKGGGLLLRPERKRA
jgi:predicted DNA-binding transcriptional regulator YafY